VIGGERTLPQTNSQLTIGVLGLQGDIREHIAALQATGANAVIVRTAEEIAAVAGLIIPGGESTTVGILLERFGLLALVRGLPAVGVPVFGTCTGMILLAKDIENSTQPRLGLVDVTVRRNAFGRQVDSFEEDVTVAGIAGAPMRAVFIRSPFVTRVGPEVQVLARVGEHPVLVRHGLALACAFHPELTGDGRLHCYFLHMVAEATALRDHSRQTS
jgi:pyridoxal 5'-phosphate synthase pdxT subunit